MTNETKLLKEASKIVPGPNYSESIDDEYNLALWALNLVQKQDDEVWVRICH